MKGVKISRDKFDLQLPKHDYVGISFFNNNPSNGFEYLILGSTYYYCTAILTSGELQRILIDVDAEGGKFRRPRGMGERL